MTTKTITSPSIPVAAPGVFRGSTALGIGIAGIAVWLLGALLNPAAAASAWLISICFWTALSLGMIFFIMLHHMFDAGWSTIVRRICEHWLAVFPWLAVLFVPLLVLSILEPGVVWKWMAVDKLIPGTEIAVGDDLLYQKKSPYLNVPFFLVRLVLYFGAWVAFAHFLRKFSFAQDNDGNPAHTLANRKLSAAGLFVVGFTATFASFDWIMSLEYHWFSTIFGVWFFSSAMRAAFAALAIICLLLVRSGHLEGIFSTKHLHDLASLMFAFTVFWAYISFSQYFLIWNANIPEVTFWYNVREEGFWWPISLFLIFGHFLLPFLFLLFYTNKIRASRMIFISVWILLVQLLDMVYNILPTRKLADGSVHPFTITLWDGAAIVGIGAICVWAFARSLETARLIPIRDPRINESLRHHE
ncbi:MAG: hypothetical protein EA425_02830 [Puniceicoccaceae bacterium]|nr:MAG: hypothetical protein EA425_02830 [Puniceicoccaceae bacterium]